MEAQRSPLPLVLGGKLLVQLWKDGGAGKLRAWGENPSMGEGTLLVFFQPQSQRLKGEERE